MHFETLVIQQNGAITTIIVNRPNKLNALSQKVLTELRTYLVALNNQQDFPTKGIILTGAGDKAFIAGADIKSMAQMTPEEGEKFGQLGQEVTCLLETLHIPVIACVNGYALGGGCEMAMACDYIFATKNAKFGQPEVNLGLIPGFGGCVRLIRHVGPGKAKELIYTGRIIGAEEAKSIGLVNNVFINKTTMIQAAIASIQLIARKSPVAVSLCKKVINQIDGENITTGLQIEKSAFRASFESPDKAEGVAAFLEKREPVFGYEAALQY